MTAVTKLARNGALPLKQTVFLLCDMQERFRTVSSYFEEITKGASRLTEASKILNVPLIVTEQNPKALGSTVKEIDISHAVGTFPKTKFSMCIPEVLQYLDDMKDLSSVVLFGIETHVCIEQTAIDLRNKGLNVHVVGDATSSRSVEDRLLAFERLRQIGCYITTCENVIFKLLQDKNHPKFNEIRPLVAAPTIPTGLCRLPSSLKNLEEASGVRNHHNFGGWIQLAVGNRWKGQRPSAINVNYQRVNKLIQSVTTTRQDITNSLRPSPKTEIL